MWTVTMIGAWRRSAQGFEAQLAQPSTRCCSLLRCARRDRQRRPCLLAPGSPGSNATISEGRGKRHCPGLLQHLELVEEIEDSRRRVPVLLSSASFLQMTRIPSPGTPSRHLWRKRRLRQDDRAGIAPGGHQRHSCLSQGTDGSCASFLSQRPTHFPSLPHLYFKHARMWATLDLWRHERWLGRLPAPSSPAASTLQSLPPSSIGKSRL